MSKIFLISIFFIINNHIFAQKATKYSNEFLAIGVGARGIAMANTQSSIAQDVTAGYWNPAGLLDIKEKYQFSLMHASLFAGIANYDYAAFATSVDKLSKIGLTIVRLGVDNILDTRKLFDPEGRINYNKITSFSAADYAFIFSYARRSNLIKDLKIGANFKVIHRNVGIFANAWGFGFDIGTQFQRDKWYFGLTAKDITTTYNIWTINSETLFDVFSRTDNPVPDNSVEITMPRILTDVAKHFLIKEKIGILVAIGFDMTFDGQRNTLISTKILSVDPHFGLEIDYKKLFFIRSGIGNFQEIKNFDGTKIQQFQPNFGIGLQFNKITIDYALTDISNQAEALYSNIFSLKMGINKTIHSKSRNSYDN